MTERAWITLVVRGSGILLLAFGLAEAGQVVVYGLVALFEPQSDMSTALASSLWWLVNFGYSVVLVAIGAYLLFGGCWVIDRFTREVVDRCRRCGYDMAGHAGAPCPECGASPVGAQNRTP